MKSPFAPTLGKSWIPLGLVGLSLIPSFPIRELIFGTLALPYSWAAGHPPFPYHDKPWFISPMGALAVAVTWAAIVYLFTGFLAAKRTSRKEEPIQPPVPTRGNET